MSYTYFTRKPKDTDKRVKNPKSASTRLGQHIWVMRFGARLTQRELAAMAGVSRKTINAIEGGKTLPSLIVAMKIAAALDVPLERLFKLE